MVFQVTLQLAKVLHFLWYCYWSIRQRKWAAPCTKPVLAVLENRNSRCRTKTKDKPNPCGLDLSDHWHCQPIASFILKKEKEKILHLCLLKISRNNDQDGRDLQARLSALNPIFYLSDVGSLEKWINPGSVGKYKADGKYSEYSWPWRGNENINMNNRSMLDLKERKNISHFGRTVWNEWMLKISK